ncbi:MAG: threonylcarbamoyl-AMP synthase [gamma proteobacterium symbiont of Bathyaustriella thionipta]|nr:threonylcarbamoyl-AMP synthase [gamma proteobacterium symbiont of Bathyaustriella thionipta]
MSQFFQIHPQNPQSRLISRAADILRDGGLVVYPTDSSYALGCRIGDKKAQDRMRQIRRLDERHNFTLVCRDLSEISQYSKIGNQEYRLLKQLTPGPYTFILKATQEVPRRLQNPKRKTIGLRIPDNPIVQDLIAAMGEPIMSTTLILPGEDMPMTDPYEIRPLLEHAVDLIIDGGYCGFEATSVIELDDGRPKVARSGMGDVSQFET